MDKHVTCHRGFAQLLFEYVSISFGGSMLCCVFIMYNLWLLSLQCLHAWLLQYSAITNRIDVLVTTCADVARGPGWPTAHRCVHGQTFYNHLTSMFLAISAAEWNYLNNTAAWRSWRRVGVFLQSYCLAIKCPISVQLIQMSPQVFAICVLEVHQYVWSYMSLPHISINQ